MALENTTGDAMTDWNNWRELVKLYSSHCKYPVWSPKQTHKNTEDKTHKGYGGMFKYTSKYAYNWNSGGEDRIEKWYLKEIMTKNIPTTTRLLAGDLRSATKSKQDKYKNHT